MYIHQHTQQHLFFVFCKKESYGISTLHLKHLWNDRSFAWKHLFRLYPNVEIRERLEKQQLL